MKSRKMKTKRELVHPEHIEKIFGMWPIKNMEKHVGLGGQISCSNDVIAYIIKSELLKNGHNIDAVRGLDVSSMVDSEHTWNWPDAQYGDYARVDVNKILPTDGDHFSLAVNNGVTMFCYYKWIKNNRPIYRISKDLFTSLHYTDVGENKFIWEPRRCLPFDCMYVSFPCGIHNIQIPGTGESFNITGFYLCVDSLRNYIRGSHNHKGVTPLDCITVVAVSESLLLFKSFTKGDRWDQDPLEVLDINAWAGGNPTAEGVVDGDRMVSLFPPDKNWQTDVFRAAYNLIWFIHKFPNAISTTVVDGMSAKGSRRQQRKQKRRDINKGVTRAGYTYLDLVSKHVKRSSKTNPTGRKWKKSTIVAGHIHTYWRGPKKENGVPIPYEEWEEKRIRVQKWILPYRKGPIDELNGNREIIVRW